jgi:hypothetical protein
LASTKKDKQTYHIHTHTHTHKRKQEKKNPRLERKERGQKSPRVKEGDGELQPSKTSNGLSVNQTSKYGGDKHGWDWGYGGVVCNRELK